jgi:ABC-type Fe3+/spermidine/putrescine transport system ATPase subunit
MEDNAPGMAGRRPIISIADVTKRFGSAVTAVDAVKLDIHEGEFFALLGPSGCGKTTLLRMIAGFEVPSEGQILIDGQDMSEVPPNRRPINMVFQSYAVFPHMSVADNVGATGGLKQLERLPIRQPNMRSGLPRSWREWRIWRPRPSG